MSAIRKIGLLSAWAALAAVPAAGAQTAGLDDTSATGSPALSRPAELPLRPRIIRRVQAPANPAQPRTGTTAPARPASPGAGGATPPAVPGQPPPPAASLPQPGTTGAGSPGQPTTTTTPTTPAPAPPAAPTTPPISPGTYAGAGATNLAAEAAATTSALSSLDFNETPIMLGDMAPLAVRQFFPTPNLQPPPNPFPGRPPVPQVPGQRLRGVSAAVPWVRGFKMADNMSPRPQDRVFFGFNYFNDLNGDINRRLGDQIHNLQAYRYILGIEKTFWDGNASIGIRMPIDNLSTTSRIPGLGGTHTAVDDLAVFSKFILWQNRQTGSLVSAGLAVVTPNGPRSFAGSPALGGFRDSQLQPYIGYIWSKNRFYAQGFESLDVPLDPHDVTMLYNDVGIGYFAYRSIDRNAFLTSIVPTFETHVNVPLNHQGALRINDIAGTPNVVDLTLGMNFVFGRNAILTFGVIDPVTGPKPFDFEVTALLNVFFGRTRALRPSPALPIIGL